jgi:hypothetical protein
MAPTTGMASYRVTRSELKQLVNLHLNDVVIRMWNKHIRDLNDAGTPFASKEELPLFSGTDDTSTTEFFEFMIKKLEGDFSAYYDKIRECATNLEKMYDAQELLQLFHEQVTTPATASDFKAVLLTPVSEALHRSDTVVVAIYISTSELLSVFSFSMARR